MSKYNFALDVTALSDYTNENTGLLAKALYGATTIDSGIEVLAGQKGDVSLNRLTHTLTLAAESCGWDIAGSTVLDQVDISVCPIKYNEALCPSTLEPKWYGQIMKAGSSPEELPFEKYIVDTKMDALSAEVEHMFWLGDLDGSGNLALCSGIIEHLSGSSDASDYVELASGATALTAANIIATVNLMVASLDERVYAEPDVALYMSVAHYKTYITALITANLYNYSQDIDGKTLKVTIPGHNIEVIATAGLRSTNYLWLTAKSNMVFCTDLLDETESLDAWYSQDNREVRVAGSFKFGTGVYFPGFVTHNIPDIYHA